MSERTIDRELTLVPYYPNEAVTLPWYQDPQLCKQVDNTDHVYTLPLLRSMYAYLSANGACYYIRYNGTLCGDATLKDDGEIAIVVCREYQNRHIGRRVISELLRLAREKGMDTVRANIYSFNAQSRRMFEACGFTQTGEEWFEYRLSPPETVPAAKETE